MNLQDILTGRYAFVFPGQGSQYVGMARELAEKSDAARKIIERADDLLETGLSTLMFDGPEEVLGDTYNAQPAIFVASIAAHAALRERAESDQVTSAPAMVAGHSLGEFTALVVADVLDFDSALKLVRARGEAMARAGAERPGAMAAVLGMDDEAIASLVEESAAGQVLTIANRNCPGQTVISGEVEAVDRFTDAAKSAGAKRVARLPISIASHSSLMDGAAADLNEVFDRTTFYDPAMPVVSNATAEPLHTSGEIREELRDHVVKGVNWTGTIQTMMANDIATFVEVGPGSVLAGLNRRIDKATTTLGFKDLGLTTA